MSPPTTINFTNVIPLINPNRLDSIIMSSKFNEALARKSRMLAMTLRDTVYMVGDEFAIKQADELVELLADLQIKLGGTVSGFVEAKEGWVARQEEIKKKAGDGTV